MWYIRQVMLRSVAYAYDCTSSQPPRSAGSFRSIESHGGAGPPPPPPAPSVASTAVPAAPSGSGTSLAVVLRTVGAMGREGPLRIDAAYCVVTVASTFHYLGRVVVWREVSGVWWARDGMFGTE